MSVILIKNISEEYRLYSALFIVLPFFLFSCNKLHTYQEKNEIQIYTILDSVKTNEITNSIINSNNIGSAIKELYKNAEIIEKNIPLQRKNFIDFYTTNFPTLASERKWGEIENKSKKTIVYLEWILQATVDTVLYFLYSSDYDCSLWVNSSPILSERGKSSAPYYQKSKQIVIKKGKNNFVVELVKKKKCYTNCFNFSLLPSNHAMNELIHTLNIQYLSQLILKEEDALHINATVLKDIIPKYSYSILYKGDTIFSSTTLRLLHLNGQ